MESDKNKLPPGWVIITHMGSSTQKKRSTMLEIVKFRGGMRISGSVAFLSAMRQVRRHIARWDGLYGDR